VDEFGSIRFDRLLIYSPGKWLVVSDDLKDSAGANHLYKQWFQFAPELRVARSGGEFVIRGVGKRVLRAVSLLDGPKADDPVRGQRTPTLQGWYSPVGHSLVPTTSASFSKRGNDPGFLTLFVFGDRAPSFDPGANTLNHFSWVSGGTRHSIDVRRNKTSTSVVHRSK
jgi:hypothetical protein